MSEKSKKFELTIEPDAARLPGMKTIMGDRSDKDKVVLIPNIEYVKREEETLRLNLLLPAGLMPGYYSESRYPLIVFVQGSGWGEQEIFYNIPQLCYMAKKGYVIASVKHRSSDKAKFPAFLQDVKSAIRFLKRESETYFINPDQVAVWGDSSGGNAAALVGLTGDMAQFKTEDNAEVSDQVKAVVDFYGPTDVSRINEVPRNPEFKKNIENSPENILYGGRVDQNPEIAEPGNPMNYITPGRKIPPFFVAHGDCDATVPFNQSVLLVQKLQVCRKMVEFYKVCGADHGIFFWTDELLDQADRFLRAYLEWGS